MKIYSEISLENFNAWSGGRDTLDVLIEKGLCDQLEAIIDSIEPEEGWSDTAINDLLWFERDNIAEMLDFSDWEDLENDGKSDDDDEGMRLLDYWLDSYNFDETIALLNGESMKEE